MDDTATGRLLKVPEVARRLRLSTQRTYMLVNAGSLPVVRLGTGPNAHIRVSERALDDWIAAGGGWARKSEAA